MIIKIQFYYFIENRQKIKEMGKNGYNIYKKNTTANNLELKQKHLYSSALI